MNDRTSNAIKFLRFLAAHLVVLGHSISSAGMTFLQYPSTPNVQSSAVLIFLFISGYLIAYKCDSGGYDGVSLFLYDRLIRLLVPLFPCLLIGLIVEYYWGSKFPFRETFNFYGFFGSLLFLDIAPFKFYPFGVNRPLWTLAVEWWLYVYFAFFALNSDKTRIGKLLSYPLILISLIVFIFSFYSEKSLSLIGIWFFGAFYYLGSKIGRSSAVSIVSISGIVVLVFAGNISPSDGNYSIVYSLFISFCVCVFVNVYCIPRVLDNFIDFNSNYSYSLYLTHSIVIAYIKYYLEFPLGVQFVFLSYCMSVAVALVFWWAFEKRYVWVREAMNTVFFRGNLKA